MVLIITLTFILLVAFISIVFSFCVEYDGGKANKVFLRCMLCRQEIIVDKEKCVTGDGKTFIAKCPLCGGVMINDALLWSRAAKRKVKENEDSD